MRKGHGESQWDGDPRAGSAPGGAESPMDGNAAPGEERKRGVGCSVLAPQCEKDKVIKPCRHVCENLKKNCLSAFDAIDMAWPYFLDCDRFFAGEEEGCFDPLAKLRGKERKERCSVDTFYST